MEHTSGVHLTHYLCVFNPCVVSYPVDIYDKIKNIIKDEILYALNHMNIRHQNNL